jgi:hypothetical protein
MRKLAAAALLAGFALSASAYDFGGQIVANPQDCPPGSDASVNYTWQNGHFVRNGWACQIRSDN